MKKRALIHVENTQNLEELAEFLHKSNWELISANKTESFLKNLNIPVTHHSALELSSKISPDYADLEQQILAAAPDSTDIDGPESLSKLSYTAQQNEISLICMNFRPSLFDETQIQRDKELNRPSNFFITSILRTAYYNGQNVLILTDPEDYKEAILQLMTDSISQDFRTYLSAKALNMVSAYDSGLAYSLLNKDNNSSFFMNYMTFPYTQQAIHKGANKHQKACLYGLPIETGAVRGLKKISSEDLNYNLVSDVSLAWELISTLYTNLKNQNSVKSTNADGYDFITQFTPLTGTVFTIAIKFRSILNASISSNALDSIMKTSYFDNDIQDVSLGCSSVIDEEAAKAIINHNYTAIIAPAFTDEAKNILSEHPEITLIPASKVSTTGFDGKILNGGLLIQTRDTKLFDHWQVKTKNRPDQLLIDEMAFGTLLTLGTRSYCALLLKDNHLVAIAQSCTTNKKALDQICIPVTDYKETGDILVCDAPITFCDSLKYLIEKGGVKAILQPGGTEKDEEFAQYCNEHDVVMIFTDMTHIYY